MPAAEGSSAQALDETDRAVELAALAGDDVRLLAALTRMRQDLLTLIAL